jgi:rhodanese-related sulfurtransferase
MNDQLMHYSNKLAYEIDSWDLKAARKAGENITVIDARSPEAFQREHIPGSINVPHRTMSAETTKHINKDALVVTYCDGIGCNGSTKGALNMLKLGFRVKELIGALTGGNATATNAHCRCAQRVCVLWLRLAQSRRRWWRSPSSPTLRHRSAVPRFRQRRSYGRRRSCCDPRAR